VIDSSENTTTCRRPSFALSIYNFNGLPDMDTISGPVSVPYTVSVLNVLALVFALLGIVMPAEETYEMPEIKYLRPMTAVSAALVSLIALIADGVVSRKLVSKLNQTNNYNARMGTGLYFAGSVCRPFSPLLFNLLTAFFFTDSALESYF
jgi:hypothetical protein